MLLTCIRKEILHSMLTARYALVFALFVILPFAACVVRTQTHCRLDKDYHAAPGERLELMNSLELDEQSRGLGVTVESPPNPLAIFAGGLQNEMTRSYTMSEWTEPRTGDRKLWNPSFRFFLSLDMVLIVNVICSLLAVLLVFDSISGERESGTLKVLLAGPVPRDTLIVAKLLAGLVTLALPLVAAWLLCLLYVSVLNRIALSADQAARLGLIVLMSGVYLSFFFALGIAASAWCRRSATALALCMLCWVVFVLAIPNAVPLLVNRLAPIPAPSKIYAEKGAIADQVDNELVPVWRKELSDKDPYRNDQEALGRELWTRESEELAKRFAKVDRFYDSQVENQVHLTQYVSRLSPSAAFVYGATHCAGTGVQDFLRLLADVGDYQRAFADALNEQQRKHIHDKPVRDAQWRMISRYDPSAWPVFRSQGISLAATFSHSWVDLVLLVGGTILLFLVAFVGFLRYDPL